MYMEGVHPLLTFCLLYSPPPVYMALLNAGADPCASLCSIAIFGYQVLGDRMRTLLQAGAFLAKSTVDEQMVEYLLDSDFLADPTIMEITHSDLRLAIDESSCDIRRFLATRAAKYTKDDTESQNKCALLKATLLSGPESLKSICRSVIRHRVGKIKLFEKIESLALPCVLKQLLRFGYVNLTQ